MALVRVLTAAGRDAFRGWIKAGAAGEPPRHLLEGGESSERVKPDAVVSDEPFATRMGFGRHLSARLDDLPFGRIRFDAGLWDWLSLFYVDQLLPVAADGKRKPSGPELYCLEGKRLAYRHLVGTAWEAVKVHGEAARFLLSRPMHEHGQLLESIAGQQQFFGSPTLIAVADALYWDEAAGKVKRGVAVDPKKVAKAGGVVRRLMPVSRQLGLTYDLDAMTSAQVLDLLPREFERWKPVIAGVTGGAGAAADAGQPSA